MRIEPGNESKEVSDVGITKMYELEKRQKMLEELAEDADNAMAEQDVFGVIHSVLGLKEFIRNWKPKEKISPTNTEIKE